MMKKRILGSIALLGILMTAGCGDDGDNGFDPISTDTNPNPGGTDQNTCQNKDVTAVCATKPMDGVYRITDADNYFFKSNIAVTPTVVKGNTNLTIKWDGLTTDLFGRPMNPMTDVDLVLVSLWELDQVSLADQINRDVLEMNANEGAAWVLTNKQMTQSDLFSFGIMGSPTEPARLLPYFDNTQPTYNPATWTHLIMAQSGTTPGSNARMLGFFTLGETDNTTINLTPESAVLTYKTNIRNQNWLAVEPNNPNIVIDGTGMNLNVAGNPFVPTKINRFAVGHYNMNACEIENDFLNLEENAIAWYEKNMEIVTESYNLAETTDATGVPFPGIDNTGVWIVALQCGTCANSAPWFLTVLHACPSM